MKIDTIKWRIFKYNIAVIFILITVTTIIFNAAVRMYIKTDIVDQLNKIASNAEETALQHGPDFFPKDNEMPPHDRPKDTIPPINLQYNTDPFRFYFMLDRSLKAPFSLLNADFILLDTNKNRIIPFQETSTSTPIEIMKQAINQINNLKDSESESELVLKISGIEYIAVIKPVSDKNSFGLGWIIIYSSIQKVNQLQLGINIILLIILIFSALIAVVFSSRASKKISEPFYHLNKYVSDISERNFKHKIEMPVYNELSEFVHNINVMSEKLETYDKAQKTFLQNASHEFRTPLMSIQCYAEGIKYNVVDNSTAIEIILAEIKRMTNLVEDLLYLSRLDSIKENYTYTNIDFNKLIGACVRSINLLAEKNNIVIHNNLPKTVIKIYGDEEKLSRAINNIISNCVRYANSIITIELKKINNKHIKLLISDDGCGFNDSELSNIFERFYKGSKGNFGLGLSISKNIIEKLNGKITAKNSNQGALFIIELPIIIE